MGRGSEAMTVKSVQDLFINELRDIYYAEKQGLRGWQKLAKDGENKANGRDVTLADGRKLFLGSSNPDAEK